LPTDRHASPLPGASRTQVRHPFGIETLELHASGLTFDAVADGPADGPLVLLLHGFPQTKRSWAAVMKKLGAAGRRVVAPDLRGYSPGARAEPYDVRTLVGDVLGMADALGAERFDLVGHDWGGAIAWQTAMRRPGRLRTLTAVSTPHPLAFTRALREDDDQRARSQYMRRYAAGGALEHPEDDSHDVAPREAVEAGLRYYRAQSAADLDGAGPVTVPTLYVWSTEDAALGRAAAEWTADHVTAPYRFVVLEGLSHWIPEDRPDELAGLILEHVRNVQDEPLRGV
jgi:pimeloyl-ACP methyl ester carboxylesterase